MLGFLGKLEWEPNGNGVRPARTDVCVVPTAMKLWYKQMALPTGVPRGENFPRGMSIHTRFPGVVQFHIFLYEGAKVMCGSQRDSCG